MTSLLDVGVSALTLNGISYTLLKIAGVGGSSIVYKARLNGCSDYCMIKEFYPYDLTEGRETDGTVRFLEGKTDAVQNRKSRAMRESEIAMRLRYTEENNDPWILQYEKPIEKNNTLYTIITTEKGEMLSERISEGYYVDKDFTILCDCILAILDALEAIHDKGYLHLDISPDNIHCSKLNIMRMIDYNSAYSSSNPFSEFFPSFKRSYSDPELKKIPNAKSFCLNPATDLFSVAAIFFTILKGRPLEENDWAIPSRWFLNNEEGYLKGASTLLIDSTNAFLKKNLSRTPKLRLQSVAEMRAKIEELKMLRQRIELENSPKRPNVHFVCREKEISDIDEYLQKDSYVILEGIGGIGKTELAKKYAWENREKYDIVQFITYSRDLQETVAYSMKFYNFDTAKIAQYESKYGNEAVQNIYQDKISSLRQEYHGKRTLIVVDNYNTVADDHFAEFVSGNYKVIFTSREKHDGNTIEITEMTDDGDLMKLFSEYYALDKLVDDQVAVVLEIIGLVLGHTMTLMLIATAMQKSMKTPAEMLARLRNGLDPKLRTKIAVDKEGISAAERENVVYEHIRNLFNMEEIIANENYSFIMTNMAIIPHTGVGKKTFYIWALSERYKSDEYDDEDYTDIDGLIDHRWIQYDGETHYVSLHPVISDLAYRELKPDSVKCSAMIKGMIEYAEECLNKTYIEHSAAAEMLELTCKRVKDETELTSNMYAAYNQVRILVGDCDSACDYIDKALVISATVYGKSSVQYAALSLQAGNSFIQKFEYDSALSYFSNALKVFIAINGADHYSTASVYNSIGNLYLLTEDFKEAESYLKKALDICKRKKHKRNYSDVLMISYQQLGLMCTIFNKKDRAKIYLDNALSLAMNIAGDESIYTASVYNIKSVNSATSDDEKALIPLVKALEVNRKVFGENHPTTAFSYYQLGSYYMNKDDYPKAIENFNNALNLYKKRTDYGKYIIMLIYESLGYAYGKIGDGERMIEYFRNVPETDPYLFNKAALTFGPAYAIGNVGAAFMKNHPDEAARCFIAALAFQIKIFGENSPETIRIRLAIGAFFGEKNKEIALMQYEKVLEIYKTLSAANKIIYDDWHELAKIGKCLIEMEPK